MTDRQFYPLAIMAALSACVPAERPVMIHDVRPAESEETAAFEAAGEPFTDAATCSSYLARLVAQLSSDSGVVAAQGPYPLADGDVRAHAVRAADGGHQVVEYRCLGRTIEARSWSEITGEISPFTLEAIQKMTFPQPSQPSPAEPPPSEEPR